MKYPFNYPHTIKNFTGEELTFHSLVEEDGVPKMIVYNKVQPGAGPVFHVHFKQDECLTVLKGRMGYQVDGEEEKFLQEGEAVLFSRGQMHRFWNAGQDLLECEGWVKPKMEQPDLYLQREHGLLFYERKKHVSRIPPHNAPYGQARFWEMLTPRTWWAAPSIRRFA